MDYYTITSVVAIILLLVILIWVWYVSSNALPSEAFPNSKNVCPDYWRLDPSGNCIVNITVNSGKEILSGMPPSSVVTRTDGSKSINFSDPGWNNPIGTYLNVQQDCNLTAWSTANNVLWDGVSNSSRCASSVQSSALVSDSSGNRQSTP